MPRLPSPERELFWRNLISQRPASAMTVAAFCQQAGVSVPSYYQWQRKLLAAEQPSNPVAQPVSPLVPVRIVDDRTAALIVELPGNVRVRVPPGYDAACLERVLRAVLTVCREQDAC